MSVDGRNLPTRARTGSAAEARRLLLEFRQLKRRLADLADGGADAETLRRRLDQTARDLGSIKAESVRTVESKLRVVLDLLGDDADRVSHRLIASAVADLHYLAILSGPES